MQKPSEAKRTAIVDAAARLFAERPFHEVTLDDVAAAAKVGKGTLYTYFDGKETLFSRVIDEALARFVEEVRRVLGRENLSARERLSIIIRELVRFGRRFPDRFRLLREGSNSIAGASSRTRDELVALIQSVLENGVRAGEIHDLHPDLTAVYVVSCIRGALIYGPDHSERVIVQHIERVLGRGLLPTPQPDSGKKS